MATEGRIRNREAERYAFRIRAYVAAGGILVLSVLLLSRLLWLQLFHYEYFSTRAEDNRLRVEVVQAVRGLIYDRNGIVLAENLPSFNLEIVPDEVADLDETLTGVAALIEVKAADLERFAKLRKRTPRFKPVVLRQRLNEQEVARFEVNRHQFPGVAVKAALIRHYPLNDAAAHVIGYVSGITEQEQASYDANLYRGATHTGKAGVEYSYEKILHGTPGYRIIETNAAGSPLREVEFKRPYPGQNVYLTIDARLQAAAEAALAPNEGAVVAIEPATGGVLALASRPNFDPNLFVTGIDPLAYKALNEDPLKPLYNRALQGQYPPGSTVKPMMALGGLEGGEVGLGTRRSCPGYYRLGGKGRRYRCWRQSGHGSVGLAEAIVQSCDVYFYMLAAAMGVDRIHDWVEHFSFGRLTGIDLPREKSGLSPSSEWKQKTFNDLWYPGESLSVGIGQGYLSVTPMQLAQMTTVLAQRGHAYIPHVLYAAEDGISGEILSFKPQAEPPFKLKNPGYWERVIDEMENVVHGPRGTAARIGQGLTHYRMAGKTGTAQVRNMSQAAYIKSEHQRKEERDHAWFVAFGPADAPKIAVSVLAEHGGHGSSAAAPIARKVFDAWLGPPPEPPLAKPKRGRPR
ncbi:MAG: penicillin-binding protein 2 [Nevskiales bacterium]